jgi:hypothetical protein
MDPVCFASATFACAAFADGREGDTDELAPPLRGSTC